MNINSNTVVSITYELHTTTPEGQQVFVEKANEEQPLVFLYGVGMMLPKFEEHLAGLKPGDEYSFELSPEHGYGEIDATAYVDLPVATFQGQPMPNVGDIIPLQDDKGNQYRAGVTGVHDEYVSVDFNHPMAGKNLIFSGKVLAVREATAEELSHGHAHGADGHSGH